MTQVKLKLNEYVENARRLKNAFLFYLDSFDVSADLEELENLSSELRELLEVVENIPAD